MRIFASSLSGNRDPITEDSLTPNEKRVIAGAIKKAESQGRKVIGYGDYGDNLQATGTEAVINALMNPGDSVAFTLGMAKFKKDKQGNYLVEDSYNFNGPSKEKMNQYIDKQGGYIPSIMNAFAQNGLLGVGNLVGNMMFTDSDPGRKVSIKIPPELFTAGKK